MVNSTLEATMDTSRHGDDGRNKTKSALLKSAKERILSARNVARTHSLRRVEARSTNGSHNDGDVRLSHPEGTKDSEPKANTDIESAIGTDHQHRSHSFSIKDLKKRMFPKTAAAAAHEIAVENSTYRAPCDISDSVAKDSEQKPGPSQQSHSSQTIATVPSFTITSAEDSSESADDFLPQPRRKSSSWSSADAKLMLQSVITARCAALEAKRQLDDAECGKHVRKQNEKPLVMTVLLKRFLPPPKVTSITETTSLDHAPFAIVDDGLEPEMRPKANSFNFALDLLRHSRSVPSNVNVPRDNVGARNSGNGRVEISSSKRLLKRRFRLPRSASLPQIAHRIPHKRKALSACSSPLCLPTRLRFCDSTVEVPLSEEFRGRLQQIRSCRWRLKKGVTRNIIKGSTKKRCLTRRRKRKRKLSENEENNEWENAELESDFEWRDFERLPPLRREKWIPYQKVTSIGKPLCSRLTSPLPARIQRFREIFETIVGRDEMLIASFSCAFKEECVLTCGHLYVSERNVSFYGRLVALEVRFTIPLCRIANITMEKCADFFPNSISMETFDDENFFLTAFTERDRSFEILQKVWRSAVTHRQTCFDISGLLPPKMAIPIRHRKSQANINSNIRRVISVSDKVIGSCSVEVPLSRGPDVTSLDEVPGTSDSCPCQTHMGKVLLDGVFPINNDQLFDHLFSEVPWYRQFEEYVKGSAYSRLFESISGYRASEWVGIDVSTNCTRTASYTMALKHAMAPKSTVVTEQQVCVRYPLPQGGFMVKKETHNSGIPYADSFLIQITYCVIPIGGTHSRLLVHGGVIYKKNIWSIVRGYIEKSAYAGIEDHYAALELALKTHCSACEKSARASVDRRLSTCRDDHHAVDVSPAQCEDEIKNRLKGGNPKKSRELASVVLATQEAHTQTSAPANVHSLPYARLIIALLAALVVLHFVSLLKHSPVVDSLQCSASEHLGPLAMRRDGAADATTKRALYRHRHLSAMALLRETLELLGSKLLFVGHSAPEN